MSSDKTVLDTSALLAFIEDEPGADRVEEVLRSGKVLIPWPVLMETYYVSQREKGQAEADKRYALSRHYLLRLTGTSTSRYY